MLPGAALVVEAEFASGRLTAVPLEGRACLAEWERGGQRVVLHTSTQVPHLVRTTVAGVLGVDEHRVRVVAPDVGGGFGQKCVVAREEVLVCVAARAVGAPVKWVEDRVESLLAGFQGHEQRFNVRAGFDAEGRMLAVDADIVADVGAYSTHPFTCGVEPLMAATEMLGPYRVGTTAAAPARSRPTRRRWRPTAASRDPDGARDGAPAAEGGDRARARGRRDPPAQPDPAERSRTSARPASSIDEGSYHESVELCARTLDLPGFRERQRAAREEGRLLGLGLSVFAERTGYGTEAFAQRKMAITPGYDTALVRMDPSGSVLLRSAPPATGRATRPRSRRSRPTASA